jgi:hypothetical protein
MYTRICTKERAQGRVSTSARVITVYIILCGLIMALYLKSNMLYQDSP